MSKKLTRKLTESEVPEVGHLVDWCQYDPYGTAIITRVTGGPVSEVTLERAHVAIRMGHLSIGIERMVITAERLKSTYEFFIGYHEELAKRSY